MIKHWDATSPFKGWQPAIVTGVFGGVYVAPVIEVHRAPNVTVRFICDTYDEAESIRKLLEAVRRRYELRLNQMVSP